MVTVVLTPRMCCHRAVIMTRHGRLLGICITCPSHLRVDHIPCSLADGYHPVEPWLVVRTTAPYKQAPQMIPKDLSLSPRHTLPVHGGMTLAFSSFVFQGPCCSALYLLIGCSQETFSYISVRIGSFLVPVSVWGVVMQPTLPTNQPHSPYNILIGADQNNLSGIRRRIHTSSYESIPG